jgi:signal transduction histidine kinase
MQDQLASAFRTMSDAVLAIAAEHTVEPILQKLVDSARELVDARYAALGVPDGDGGFAQFLVSGMSDELIEAMGPLPRTHGLLGAILESDESYRTGDIRRDPRFTGWWPRMHPNMRSFLGVPISTEGRIIGAFYLTEKRGGDDFGLDDQQLIELLAAHAAIAIEKARLYERSRELSIVEERNRLARELHDSVSQRMFGVILTAQAALTLLDRDPVAGREQVARVRELAQEAADELRSVVFELRPPALEREGLSTALRKHVDVLRRVHGREVRLQVDGPLTALSPEQEGHVFRIAQEALSNALRHGQADTIDVRLEGADGRVGLAVTDDGAGFDPAEGRARSRSLGLTSMEERAHAVGGRLEIRSRPGEGTEVRLEVGG